MALPAVLLKAKGALKKGAAAYNAGKQAKSLTDGEEASSSPFKLPLIIGGVIFAVAIFIIITIIAVPFILASVIFGSGSSNQAYAGNLNYLQWALNIANDDSHGYSQCNRTGPDYDCASFVWYSLVEGAGFDSNQMGNYPFKTDGEASVLKANGFKEYTYTGHSDLQPGDILLRNGHTGIYAGEDKVVEASIAETGGVCGVSGDQTGKEIHADIDNGNWDTYYRLEG